MTSKMASRGESNFFDSSNLEEFLYFEHDNSIAEESSSEDGEEEDEEDIDQRIVTQLRADISQDNNEDDESSESENEQTENENGNMADATEIDHKTVAGCLCEPGQCISSFSSEYLSRARELAQSIRAQGKHHYDLMILGKISVTLVSTDTVSTKSHRSKERLKSRNSYMHEGKCTFFTF